MLLKLSEKVSLSTEDYVNIFSVPNFVSPDYAGLACVAGVWKRRERGFGARGKREGRARRKPLFSPSRLLIMYAK